MIAYYFTLALMIVSFTLMVMGTVCMSLVGKKKIAEEPVTGGKKVLTLVFSCLALWLYFEATIGTSPSQFAFGLFVVHATTMCMGTIRGLMNTNGRVYNMKTMLTYTGVATALLVAYIYYGIAYL